KLGPILWQFAGTKKFDATDFGAFLKLLPHTVSGTRVRHALEVRHESFRTDAFYDLARSANASVVFADSDDYPQLSKPTADFTYARLMRAQEGIETGYSEADLKGWLKTAKTWAKAGDVYVYFINGAKIRAPHAAMAFLKLA